MVEPLENGQVDQQIRRRPLSADASLRATEGLSHSHSLGLAGSQSSPKAPRSPKGPTPNGDHHNGPSEARTAQATARERGDRPRTAWELPNLIRPLPPRRRVCPKRPRLLRHYAAAVEFVYNSRFAVAAQIQRRFSEYLRSPRTAQYQLANLVQLGYLATAPVSSTSPNFPYVYYATDRGVRLVREHYATLGLPVPDQHADEVRQPVSLDSVLHELLLTEFEMAVCQTLQNRGDLKRLASERRYFRSDKRLEYLADGKRHAVIPDYGFVLATTTNMPGAPLVHQAALLHLVELDNGTMSLRRIQAKYAQYEAWAQSGGERYLATLYRRYGFNPPRPNFRLLVIAHDKNRCGGDERRLIDLLALALELPAAMRDRIWLTTAQALRCREVPLDGGIWVRARDARPWKNGDMSTRAGIPAANADTRYTVMRKFIGKWLTELPRHTLFPRQRSDFAVRRSA